MKSLLAKQIIALLCTVCVALGAAPRGQLDASQFLEYVKALSSDDMRGRATGAPELEKAAQFIARQFRDFGLESLNGSSYFQEFPVTTNAKLGRANRFSWRDSGQSHTLKFQEDFIPFNLSSAGKYAGGAVFVGYGITAREYNYDDYEGLDVKDKVVIVMRHEPQEYDEKSVFEGKVYTEHSQLFSKAVNAKMHGARGVIFVADAPNHTGDSDQLEKFGRTVGPADARIAFVQVKVEVLDKWLAPSGRSLKAIHEAIDKDLKPQSFALPESLQLDLHVDVEREVKMVRNVEGYLRGQTDEYVVIGAHYDHLGLGEQFSMAPSQIGTIHPGADDNASGTAGVLELARLLSAQPKLKRGVLFLAFAGEELGLLGSSYYVNNPRLPLGKAAAMINMDMIGRIREGKVYLGGSGTGSTLKALLDDMRPRHDDIKLDFADQGGYGSSDHASFTTKQVPVLFFFSGLHGDYHKPSDTWDKVDATSAIKLLRLIADVTVRLASSEDRPQYVRVNLPPSAHSGQVADPSRRSSGSGYGPYFGSIPDFAEPPTGVRFADVRDGSPAALAGLKAGDIMVSFDGKQIQNLYDFTYALRGKRAGDEVEVKVIRGTEHVIVKVKLAERK